MKIHGPLDKQIDNRYFADRHHMIKQMLYVIHKMDIELPWHERKALVARFKALADNTKEDFLSYRNWKNFFFWFNTTLTATNTAVGIVALSPINLLLAGLCTALVMKDINDLHKIPENIKGNMKLHAIKLATQYAKQLAGRELSPHEADNLTCSVRRQFALAGIKERQHEVHSHHHHQKHMLFARPVNSTDHRHEHVRAMRM